MDFKAKVDELWASGINNEIKALQDEVRASQDGERPDEAKRKIAELYAEKNRQADAAIEAYIAQRGERPDVKQLDRLSTWIQKHAEHDDKEADVLTASQRKRRRKRELPDAYIDEKALEQDGNKRAGSKPTVDAPGSHFDYVKFPSDGADRREFNGNVKKYRAGKQ